MTQRPRGTRDFTPDEMAARAWAAARMRGAFAAFGYKEVQTPTFEELELFTAKSGPGVISELYNFKDKGDREVCLRPELTAPVMRMYFQEHFTDPKPIKWFYHGSCFRYDRPQAGRYREFWQFGCEQIGAGTPLAYAELIALGDAVMDSVGLRNREFFVGHVRILKHCVDCFGFDAATRSAMMRAIDKRDDNEIRRLARMKEGCEGALDRLFLVMDAPTVAAARNALQTDLLQSSQGDAGVAGSAGGARTAGVADAAGAAGVAGVAAGSEHSDDADRALLEAVAELEAVMQHLQSFGVRGVRLNLGIARGLDYYTGIVFEMHCPILGAEKQLLGGGGYDLSAVFGAQPTPTMGFGLGFDRTLVALEKEGATLPKASGPLLFIGGLGDAGTRAAAETASTLRARGVSVDIDLMGRKPGAIAKHADAVGARYLVIVGDRDLAAGAVKVKRLDSGAEETVPLPGLAEWLTRAPA